MPHREIAQHKRFGFAHQLDLPRRAAGGLGVIRQAQQLIQQPHRRVAQLARGGVLGIAPLFVQNVGDGLAERAAVDTVPAEIVRNAADLKAHHGQKAVRLHGVRVDEKLQPLILAARQVERLVRRSKADGGVCLRHDGVFLRPVGDGPPPGAAEVKDQQPRSLHGQRRKVAVQPGKAEPDSLGQRMQPLRGRLLLCFHGYIITSNSKFRKLCFLNCSVKKNNSAYIKRIMRSTRC